MKRALLLGGLLSTAGLAGTLAAFQQAPAAPMLVEVDKVKDNLYVLKGGGGNTAVFIRTDGITVVDTKNPGWGQPILNKIKEISNKPITTIINTHTHGDHVSGNVEFPAPIEIVVQENTKANMQEMRGAASVVQTGPPTNIFKTNNGKGLPTRTFKDKMTIGKGADQIDLYYLGRAHTNGDAYVVFPALRVMHVGDTMPTRDLPIMDSNNGGTGVGFSKTLATAANLGGVDTIINGHNPTTTTPADLKIYSEFIADFVAFVQDGKKSGKTLDDVVNTWKTPAKYTGYAATPNPMRLRSDAQLIWDETK